ncbi:hypothetical protein IFM89_038116 [Coptis chinensis]|uniref:Uncharacterized protein n=1 Tax=Coptis chinensis TaxID=261450 RepID=A0A835HT78_9MAGN|nr:hypothetical protein IFM89_038116 [Coptis chinensis]
MGSICYPSKRYYDLSMSKRTRKSLKIEEICPQDCIRSESLEKEMFTNVVYEEDVNHRSSLKELIDGEEEVKAVDSKGEAELIVGHNEEMKLAICEEEMKATDSNGEAGPIKQWQKQNEGKGASLGHHFTEEEKQLQIVSVQDGGSAEGLKLGRMLSRYVKVFNHLVKLKKDHRLGSARKKPVIRFTM